MDITKNLKESDCKIIKDNVFIETNGKKAILLIHALWCGHCIKFHNVYEELNKKLNDNGVNTPCLAIESEELNKNQELSKALNFQGFPTIKSIGADGKVLGDYTGERNIKDLLTFFGGSMQKGGTDPRLLKTLLKKSAKKHNIKLTNTSPKKHINRSPFKIKKSPLSKSYRKHKIHKQLQKLQQYQEHKIQKLKQEHELQKLQQQEIQKLKQEHKLQELYKQQNKEYASDILGPYHTVYGSKEDLLNKKIEDIHFNDFNDRLVKEQNGGTRTGKRFEKNGQVVLFPRIRHDQIKKQLLYNYQQKHPNFEQEMVQTLPVENERDYYNFIKDLENIKKEIKDEEKKTYPDKYEIKILNIKIDNINKKINALFNPIKMNKESLVYTKKKSPLSGGNGNLFTLENFYGKPKFDISNFDGCLGDCGQKGGCGIVCLAPLLML